MKSKIFVFLVLWGTSLFAQSGEVVGTFSVQSYIGSDPSPSVTGFFNSTLGFLPQSVDTGDILVARQVFAGNHRRKLYRVTGITGNSPLTLSMTLIYGTSGGPFPSGTQAIVRPTANGSLYDVPNVSQEEESYILNYTINNLEGMDVDTVEERNDSLFIVLNNGDEFYAGPTSATAIDESYQVGDSIFVVSAGDTIFTGIAYANPEIDTIYNDGTYYWMVTTEGDTIEIGATSQVTANGVHPTNPPTYLIHIDTLGADTIYFDNNGTWVRFNTGGSTIGSPFFSTGDNFATFAPPGVPPIGAFIADTQKGGISRKTSVAGYLGVLCSNGRNVRNGSRYVESGDLDTWNIGLNASALLAITGNRALIKNPPDIAAPLGLGGQTSQGNTRTLILDNTTGSGSYVRFESKWRNVDGFQLDSFLVLEGSKITLDFSWDVHDGEEIMRLVGAEPNAASGGSYTFTDSANGIDLLESGGTVTVSPDIIELTYAAVASADSLMIYDNSTNTNKRTSVAEIVALASAGSVTVTDQANGLDIDITAGNITIAPDIVELTNTTVAADDSLMVWDASLNAMRRVNAGSIGNLATVPVLGVTDQANGLDIGLSGSSIIVSHDMSEFTSDPTYNGTEEFFFYDLIDGQYKKATTSWLSGGYMDLSTNQTASGVKKFTAGLQYGSGALPTGSLFGAEQATTFFLKAGATMTDANYINASGFSIHTVIDVPSGGHQQTIFTATGNDTGNDYGEFLFRVSNGANVFTNAAEFDNLGRFNLLRSSPSGATGAAGGDINTGISGIGFEGGISNYRIFPTGSNIQSLSITDGGFLSDYLSTGQSGWVLSSDSIIKHDIAPLTFSKQKLRAFKGYSYKLNRSDSTQIGVIAQDFVDDFPEALADETADTLGIYPHSVAAIAYGAVGFLQQQLDERKDSVSTEITAVDTLLSGRITPINSTGAVSLSVHPPLSPTAGEWFAISDSRNVAATDNIVINFTAAGQKYLGQSSTNYTLSTNGGFARFTYVNSTVGWIKTN